MAVTFKTTTPNALLADFKKKIDSKEIVTWAYDADGDFYHTPEQWRFTSWMRPSFDLDGLRFNILRNTKKVTTKAVYGVLHGRLAESFATHCDHLFTDAVMTARATNADSITTKVNVA